MTSDELQFLKKKAKAAKIRLDTLLNKLFLNRHNSDKVPRCLYCGVCIPYKFKNSIYEEFCNYCESKL